MALRNFTQPCINNLIWLYVLHSDMVCTMPAAAGGLRGAVRVLVGVGVVKDVSRGGVVKATTAGVNAAART